VWKLTSEFTIWVLLSGFIAIPMASMVMNRWLNQFAYHTNLDVSIFGVAWAIGLTLAAITVSWQSFKAANKNPIEALRYE
jgi:putative ABC transport system permease protein